MDNALEIGKFLLTLAALATAYAKIQSSIRSMNGKGEMREITNNPLNTQKVSRTATMEDVENVTKQVKTLERRFDKHLDGIETNQIEIEHKVDGLKDSMNDRFDDFRDRIDDKMEVLNRSIGRLEGGGK